MEFLTFFLIILCLLRSSQACHPIDQQALLDFKHKITYDPSNLLQTWTPKTDCCKSWYGIACDSKGRVVNVTRSGLESGDDYIRDTSMSGTLSTSLGNLTCLQLLDLSNLKDLKGQIPPEFGNLSRLTHLFLDTIRLSGSIPVTFRFMSKLKKLYLSNNELSGVVPDVFRSFKSLSEIGLSGNKLSGRIPSSIGYMLLYLNQNKLEGSIPASVGGLRSIEFIRLSENELTGVIPPSIGNQFTGSIPSSFGNLHNLQALDLSTNLWNAIPQEFKNLSLLMDLDLHSNNFSGDINIIFKKNTQEPLGHYNSIDVSYNSFSGPIEPDVPSMDSIVLKEFNVSGNKLIGEIPRHNVSFPVSALLGNPGLCGTPLPPCKHSF
nr:probable leucine-rich repeat receptor-like protein kinase At1g35710 [Tanacetum cinerariifolium]